MQSVFALSAITLVVVTNAASLRSAPDADAEARMAALQPVLDKLRGLDPKTFGVLTGMLSQFHGGTPQHSSFLQYLREDPEEASMKLERLAPILEHLKALDPRAFGALTSLTKQVQVTTQSSAAQKAAFIQRSAPPSTQEEVEASKKLEALQPVLDRLKGLDGKAFGMLSSLVSQAQAQSRQSY